MNIEVPSQWFINLADVDISTNVLYFLGFEEKYHLSYNRLDFPHSEQILIDTEYVLFLRKWEWIGWKRYKFNNLRYNHLNKVIDFHIDYILIADRIKETKHFVNYHRDVLMSDKNNLTVAKNSVQYNRKTH